MSSKKEGLIVYSSRKITLTEQERKDLDRKILEQAEKYKRDLSCGGIDEMGNFRRLHDRHSC